ncbi:ParB/Srx family N-terminal domain-containing protein [Serratia fonticola]|uniref:ParB/Srx family N-terminal domain-containing protein n=1 Tax=Serratia fonticola TaxID=47917 RepID=UPI0027FF7ECD|nr:ParB/Srx family N-terminal domain-containing protein [Serratia fonticola]MDQ7207701.1 ParB/Srx family N-terminal domain-containing protein [Serratia fonticola]HBE9150664.1 ParB N-terminal domain-containing protein [Serratia fonticola]
MTTVKKQEKLAIVYKTLNSMMVYAKNARTHSTEQVEKIIGSIKKYGWTNPILLDESGQVIAGHGRLLAAEKIGFDPVPTITLFGLTDAEKKAYRLADNKLPLDAGWDNDLLTMELGDLLAEGFDLTLTGFSAEEIDNMLNVDFSPGDEGDQGKLDQLEEKLCPHCGGVL